METIYSQKSQAHTDLSTYTLLQHKPNYNLKQTCGNLKRAKKSFQPHAVKIDTT